VIRPASSRVPADGDWPAPPATLRVGSGSSAVTYHHADDLVALHAPEGAGGSVSIEAAGAAAGAVRRGLTAGPVYRSTPAAEPVAPTGRALVRFPERDRAERHRDALAAAGFVLEATLPYAPHAAWVRAASGGIASLLAGLDRLSAVAEVEAVEPQLVGRAARRA
jgi:hypothetical protein